MKKTMLLAIMLSALSTASFAQSSTSTAAPSGDVYGGNGSGINDPLIRKRANDYAVKQEYKADKHAAKQDYKNDRRAAEEKYRMQLQQQAGQESGDTMNSSGSSNSYEGKAEGAID